jgi:hypothetical protein
MIVLNALVFWRSWTGIRMGLPDFSIFYTAGQIVHQGRGADLYDGKLQEQEQRSFSPLGIERRGSILPYNHPPFEAVLFVPFARVSYLSAYFLWFAINVALLFSLPYVLRPHFEILGKEPLGLWLLACFAFFPIFIALMQGQDSILILFFYCMAYAAFRNNSESRMGGWLGLALCKFHLVLPFVLPLALLARKRLIAGFLVVAAALVAVGTAVVGTKGWMEYPVYVWASDHNQRWNFALSETANLLSVISTFVSAAHPRLKTVALTLLSGLLLASMFYAWRRALSWDYNSRALAFCVALGATVLLSYHLYVHDLSLLFLVILLALESVLSTPSIRARRTIYACVGVLSCTPLYLLLVLRYRQLQIIAGVLLILVAVLWSEIMRPGIIEKPQLASLEAIAFAADENQ